MPRRRRTPVFTLYPDEAERQVGGAIFFASVIGTGAAWLVFVIAVSAVLGVDYQYVESGNFSTVTIVVMLFGVPVAAILSWLLFVVAGRWLLGRPGLLYAVAGGAGLVLTTSIWILVDRDAGRPMDSLLFAIPGAAGGTAAAAVFRRFAPSPAGQGGGHSGDRR